MQKTTDSELSPEVRIMYDRRLLIAAKPQLVHRQFADPHPLPKNNGKTVQMRRWELLPPATTPLSEGVTPAGNKLTVSQVLMDVAQYGDFVEFTDQVVWTTIDPYLTQGTDVLGEQAGKTLDDLARDAFALGTNVLYPTGRVARNAITSGDLITTNQIKRAVRTLEKASVSKINGSYVGIVSPDTKFDITALDEWIDPRKYGSATDLYNNELGTLFGVRFVESPRAKYWAGAGASSADVHGTLIFGAHAFADTSIDGEAMEMIAKALGSNGSDPLNQRGSQGWKASYGAKITNDFFVVRCEHSVSP